MGVLLTYFNMKLTFISISISISILDHIIGSNYLIFNSRHVINYFRSGGRNCNWRGALF